MPASTGWPASSRTAGPTSRHSCRALPDCGTAKDERRRRRCGRRPVSRPPHRVGPGRRGPGRRFGDLDIAEDAAAEAFASVVQRWPSDGIPPNPGGWLTTTATRKAIDRLRRESQRATQQRAPLGCRTTARTRPPGPSRTTGSGSSSRAVIRCSRWSHGWR
ncbi:sigma factor [Nostocoides australiense]|uniref:sigma factor n=1 Tax=Nostocoides australiense TaxID=99480 RepID=UPI002E0E9F0E